MSVPEYISIETVLDTPGADVLDYDPRSPWGALYAVPYGCVLHHSAKRNGYLPRGKIASIPYNGRYGIGVVLATYYSLSKVSLLYYIEEGSAQNGNRQK